MSLNLRRRASTLRDVFFSNIQGCSTQSVTNEVYDRVDSCYEVDHH